MINLPFDRTFLTPHLRHPRLAFAIPLTNGIIILQAKLKCMLADRSRNCGSLSLQSTSPIDQVTTACCSTHGHWIVVVATRRPQLLIEVFDSYESGHLTTRFFAPLRKYMLQVLSLDCQEVKGTSSRRKSTSGCYLLN